MDVVRTLGNKELLFVNVHSISPRPEVETNEISLKLVIIPPSHPSWMNLSEKD